MKVLILHDKVVSKILKRYILSAINSAQIEVVSKKTAIGHINSERYDIIVCGNEGYLKQLDLDKKLPMTCNKDTPLLVITSSSSELPALRERGVHHLLAPFSPMSLGLKLGELHLLRDKRQEHPRLHIPSSVALFENSSCSKKIEIINISMSGLLCDFPAMPLDFITEGGKLTLQFPECYAEQTIPNLDYRFLHFNAIKWNTEQNISHVKGACAFVNLSHQEEALLESVFKKVKDELYSW